MMPNKDQKHFSETRREWVGPVTAAVHSQLTEIHTPKSVVLDHVWALKCTAAVTGPNPIFPFNFFWFL